MCPFLQGDRVGGVGVWGCLGQWFSGTSVIYLQVILPLECLRAERTDVFPFVAVRQFVLGQCRGISKDLATNL